MAISQSTKPVFNKPTDKPPFKTAEPPPMQVAPNDMGKSSIMPQGVWQPIATAPTDAAARFLVRATVNGKPVGGTEILVRYRPSRRMVGRKWQSALTIIDDKLGTKLGFRPTEWCPAPASKLTDTSWDDAIKKANDERDQNGG